MTQRTYTFLELLQDDTACDFSRRLITAGYQDLAPGHTREITGMVEQSFDVLTGVTTQAELEGAQQHVYANIFHKPDADFWLNLVYRGYKRTTKPQRRFDIARGWLDGKRVLDFGCGDALFSLVLEDNSYQVSLTDVLDYRDPDTAHLPFRAMSDPRCVPYPDGSFDATCILSVLHHVAPADLGPLLDDLRRVTRRVIIDEDTYGVQPTAEGIEALRREDEFLREFMSFSLEDQRKCVIFMDYFSNVVSAGILEMNMPFDFHTVTEWEALFQAHGYRVVRTLTTGFEKVFFHRSCHTWFVLESH